MKQIQPTQNDSQWPRKAVPSIECRKRDLIVRIADWTRYKEEPAYDVEVYVGGVYDFDLSRTFPATDGKTKAQAKAEAVTFAQKRIYELL